MIALNTRMVHAIKELVDSGADAYLIEQLVVNAIEDGMHNETMREDRITRARLENAGQFDSALMAVINGMEK